MSELEPKKLALIRILQIFEKYSDFDHPLKQDDIANYLEEDYGIVIERKLVNHYMERRVRLKQQDLFIFYKI